jgi:hypothetical protein
MADNPFFFTKDNSLREGPAGRLAAIVKHQPDKNLRNGRAVSGV